MKAKDFVKSKFPNARAERQIRGRVKGFQETYWLIRDGRNTLYMASGNTESNAWVNAKEIILEEEKDLIKQLEQ